MEPNASTHPITTLVLADDRKESAYLSWAYESGQNAAEVARRLEIPPRTVQDWVKSDRWRDRLDTERKELARQVWAGAHLALSRAAGEVLSRLHRIALGHGDTKVILTRDGDPVEVELPIPYQAQVNAANSLLDRFGLTVRDQREPDRSHEDTPGLTLAELRAMTPEELRALEQRMIDQERD